MLKRLFSILAIIGTAIAFAATDEDANCEKKLRRLPPMKFPSLYSALAEDLKIQRPPPPEIEKLPPCPDPNALPKGVLKTLLVAMANQQNWSVVAYAASNHRTVKDKLRASWARDDARTVVNGYLDQLSPEQRQIAKEAFEAGMAGMAIFHMKLPESITRAWVEANYPRR